MNLGLAIVRPPGDDALVSLAIRHSRESDRPCLVLESDRLASTRTYIANDHVELNGIPIDSVIFRSHPADILSRGFSAEDAEYASAEASSVWLHILSHPGIHVINRFDEVTWWCTSDWAVWRHRFLTEGIELSPVVIGDGVDDENHIWWLWTGGRTATPPSPIRRKMATALVRSVNPTYTLICAGQTISGPQLLDQESAMHLLEVYGVVLAGLYGDDERRIIAATALPDISMSVAPRVFTLLKRRWQVQK
jgi:hypothetical protein